MAEVLRCEVTNHPVGTDTWMEGHSCHCRACQYFIALMKLIEKQEQELRKRGAIDMQAEQEFVGTFAWDRMAAGSFSTRILSKR